MRRSLLVRCRRRPEKLLSTSRTALALSSLNAVGAVGVYDLMSLAVEIEESTFGQYMGAAHPMGFDTSLMVLELPSFPEEEVFRGWRS